MPAASALAAYLEDEANDPADRMPYLDPEWVLKTVAAGGVRVPHSRWSIGNEYELPSLVSVDEADRRALMLATRAARTLRNEWRRVRDEGLLALLRDGDTQGMLAGTWTAARLRLAIDLQWPSEVKRATHSMNSMWALNALGLGDEALANEYIPRGTLLAAGTHKRMKVECNAISAVLHGEHVEQAVADARQAARVKSTPKFEQLLCSYLAAVVDHQEDEAQTTLREILGDWQKSPFNRNYKDLGVHAVPLHIYGYVDLGNRQFGWDPLQYAEEPLLDERVLRAAAYARSLTAAEKPEICRPTVTFYGRCDGLNQIFRDRPITDAAQPA